MEKEIITNDNNTDSQKHNSKIVELKNRLKNKQKERGTKKIPTSVSKQKELPTVGVISLGCDKNRVDTEVIITLLKNAGYSFTSDATKAKIIIINTCCFIKSARDEAEDTIAEMLEYKRVGKCEKLIVTGCLPQFDMKSLKNEFPEADAFIGINEYNNIVDIVKELYQKNDKIRINSSKGCLYPVVDRITTTPSYYAYMKIADGCNNFCSFCTIPYIRGRYRSRDLEDLLVEANNLVKNGVKELILVAQDTTRYGEDLYGKPKLVELLQRLSNIEGLVWIRLLYCYPEMVTDELIAEIIDNPKLCNYIDIPFQHIASPVLEKMNRKIDEIKTTEIATKLKNTSSFISVRTTFMVGFPGETKEDFNKLCKFIKRFELTNVGFFAYSREPGTVAFSLPCQIDEETKNKRLVKLVRVQRHVHIKFAKKQFVGKVLDVVCEGFDKKSGLYFGRSEYQSPEIDTTIYFWSNTPTKVGEFYKIKIKKVKNYDLEGERV